VFAFSGFNLLCSVSSIKFVCIHYNSVALRIIDFYLLSALLTPNSNLFNIIVLFAVNTGSRSSNDLFILSIIYTEEINNLY
jgi:hypothetical protein